MISLHVKHFTMAIGFVLEFDKIMKNGDANDVKHITFVAECVYYNYV